MTKGNFPYICIYLFNYLFYSFSIFVFNFVHIPMKSLNGDWEIKKKVTMYLVPLIKTNTSENLGEGEKLRKHVPTAHVSKAALISPKLSRVLQ